MFGSTNSGANAYRKVGVETGVAAANPHKLIAMLFEGAMLSVVSAIQHMQAGEVQAKGQAISKAISIIDNGLRASLDKKAGGEIALSLNALYEYMTIRLLAANLNNQKDMLEEVYQLLKDLKDAWEAIAPAATVAAADTTATIPAGAEEQLPKAGSKLPIFDSLPPQTSRLVKA